MARKNYASTILGATLVLGLIFPGSAWAMSDDKEQDEKKPAGVVIGGVFNETQRFIQNDQGPYVKTSQYVFPSHSLSMRNAEDTSFSSEEDDKKSAHSTCQNPCGDFWCLVHNPRAWELRRT